MAESAASRSGGDALSRIRASIGARPSARIALSILLLLYTVAIFTPCLANDRPWFVRSASSGAGAVSPLLASLSPIERLSMCLWPLALAALLRSRRFGARAAILATLLVAAIVWGS